MASTLSAQIAAAAAQLVAEDGMDYAQAKRKAARSFGRQVRQADLPSNEAVEDQVRAHLALYQADTQPSELAALRRLALRWMQRLGEFRPHVAGAVWRGTANRHSSIQLDLYCDDPKAAELALVNRGEAFEAHVLVDERGRETTLLSLADRSPELADPVTVHLRVRDHDDLRGALKPDSRGQSWRGDVRALQRLLEPNDAGQPAAGRTS